MNILVLGANGMAGNTIFKRLSEHHRVYGTVRGDGTGSDRIIGNTEASDINKIKDIVGRLKIDCVVNCIGLVKQKSYPDMDYIRINSVFPHRLAHACEGSGTRIVHLSTDCVFDGSKGDYKEDDEITAKDIYGQTKYCGELSYGNTVTIRTSIIGRELSTKNGLVEWFLSQGGAVKGFKNAVFSGFPTCILSDIIKDHLVASDLRGVYHVSSEPISKYDLLVLISEVFGKKIRIEPDSDFMCDRSLNCDRFKDATNFRARDWEDMIKEMHELWG